MTEFRPEGWAEPRGYENAAAGTGRIVALAGQIGWDPATSAFESDDFVAQVRQALANIVTLLASGGLGPQHVIRMTWFITDREAYRAGQKELGVAYREVFGRHYPAMSVVVVAGLIERRAKVEIEATAVDPAV